MPVVLITGASRGIGAALADIETRGAEASRAAGAGGLAESKAAGR